MFRERCWLTLKNEAEDVPLWGGVIRRRETIMYGKCLLFSQQLPDEVVHVGEFVRFREHVGELIKQLELLNSPVK